MVWTLAADSVEPGNYERSLVTVYIFFFQAEIEGERKPAKYNHQGTFAVDLVERGRFV